MVTVAERFRLLIVSQGYISSNLIGHPNTLVAQRKSGRFLPGRSCVRIASQGASILDFLGAIDYNVIILSKQ